MFDDPKKDLQWLEEQLLAEEEDRSEGSEDWFEEEEAEEDAWLSELNEARALMNNDYSRRSGQDVTFYNYEDEAGEEEELAVYADAPPKSKSKKEKKPKKEKGIGGLVFLACLETLGIIAVVLWWVLWLL